MIYTIVVLQRMRYLQTKNQNFRNALVVSRLEESMSEWIFGIDFSLFLVNDWNNGLLWTEGNKGLNTRIVVAFFLKFECKNRRRGKNIERFYKWIYFFIIVSLDELFVQVFIWKDNNYFEGLGFLDIYCGWYLTPLPSFVVMLLSNIRVWFWRCNCRLVWLWCSAFIWVPYRALYTARKISSVQLE